MQRFKIFKFIQPFVDIMELTWRSLSHANLHDYVMKIWRLVLAVIGQQQILGEEVSWRGVAYNYIYIYIYIGLPYVPD